MAQLLLLLNVALFALPTHENAYLTQLKQAATQSERDSAWSRFSVFLSELESDSAQKAFVVGLSVLNEMGPEVVGDVPSFLIETSIRYSNAHKESRFWRMIGNLQLPDEYFEGKFPFYVDYLLGRVYYQLEVYERAIFHAERFAQNTQFEEERSFIYLNALNIVGLSWKYKKQYAKAKEAYERGLAYYDVSEDKAPFAYLHGNLGLVLFLMGDTAEAIYHLRQDINLSKDYKMFASLANVYTFMGDVYPNEPALLSAYRDTLESMLVGKWGLKEATPMTYLRIYRFLAKRYQSENRLEEASKHWIRTDSIHQFITDKRTEQSLYNALFLIDEEANQVQLDLVQSELYQQDLERQFYIMLLLFSAALIALLVFFVVTTGRASKVQADQLALITEQKEQIEAQKSKIEEQNVLLLKSNENKDVLFTVISHDLRGPLRSLRDFFEMVNKGQVEKKEVYNLLPEINRNLNALHSNTDQLLSWARSQLKGVESQPKRISLRPIAEEAIALLKSAADAKLIDVEHNINENEHWAFFDAQQMRIIMRNVLQNAIKFSFAQGNIKIKVESDDGFWCLSVRDWGKGLEEVELQAIGEGLIMPSKPGTRGEGGTGLGLALSSQFARANGGKLLVESPEEGGALVKIWLPKAMEPVHDDA